MASSLITFAGQVQAGSSGAALAPIALGQSVDEVTIYLDIMVTLTDGRVSDTQ